MSGVLLDIMELIGVAAFAISGAMLGVEKHMDIFGILVLAIITAFGGGVTRDLILNVVPPSMFQNSTCLIVAFISGMAVFCLFRFAYQSIDTHGEVFNQVVNIFDAIGLGIFAVSGCAVGIENGYGDNVFLCLVLGVLTGVGGGIIRDMMVGRVPVVLHKEVYALAALVGAAIYYYMTIQEMSAVTAIFTGSIATIAIRMLATYYNWKLPKAVECEEECCQDD